MPKLLSFLASIKYKNLMDRHRSFFGYANDTNLNMFGWFYAHPEQFKIFNEYQPATAEIDENRFQYILKSLLSSAMGLHPASPSTVNSDDVLLVDVDGGPWEDS